MPVYTMVSDERYQHSNIAAEYESSQGKRFKGNSYRTTNEMRRELLRFTVSKRNYRRIDIISKRFLSEQMNDIVLFITSIY